jgi:hypothetical protein
MPDVIPLTKYKRICEYKFIMIRHTRLQFLGPLFVLVAVAMAEGAAFALGQFPTSETLWYLNLRFFSIFQISYDLLCSSWGLPYAQLYLIALPPFALAVIGLLTSRQFLLALASHLSFAYAGFLAYCGVISEAHIATASLVGVAIPTGSNIFWLVILGGACLISFLVSQSQYVVEFFKIRARIRAIH